MKRLLPFALTAALTALVSLASVTAHAEPPKPTAEQLQDARKHFQRGVALFNEADYAGALAEFRHAHATAPNPAVLYNIGQTQYQLRSYAAALQSFERYLAESGPSAEHRSEAESALDTLRTRVGKVDVVASIDGAEVTIDDELVGKTPLAPMLSAVGKRKIVVSSPGQQPVTRFVEVAAGEITHVEVKFEAPAPKSVATTPTTTEPPPAAQASSSGSALPLVLWISAGALAAGAVTTGILASSAASDLDDERQREGTDRQALDDRSSKASTLALVTDILGGVALVTAGVALYATLSSGSSKRAALPPTRIAPTRPPPPASVNLRATATGLFLDGRF